MVVGHRGWPSLFPDNTLAGFIAASEIVDQVELDVRRSGDGKLVLAHDPVLGGFPVTDTPWSVMAETDLGDGHHPALLDEVLVAIPDTPAQLEVKNMPFDSGFEPDHRIALETAERARPGDLVTSFNPASLDVVRKTYPEVPVGLAVEPIVSLGQAIRQCLDSGYSALVPRQSMIDQPLETTEGPLVFPWTVNDPRRARELAEFGATGIITDDPGLIAKTLRSET